MKKILISLMFLATLWGLSANAQQTVELCQNVTTNNVTSCKPVSTTNQLSIAVYDAGNNSGYCYTSNGSGTAATFQICGSASSGVTLGTSVSDESPHIVGDLTSGLYSAGAGLVDVGISGVKQMEISSTGITLTHPLAPSNLTQLVDTQTGTSYAIPSSDAGYIVTSNNSSAVAWTLSQATTAGYTSGFSFIAQNYGAGITTITPTTSTICGQASVPIQQNQSLFIISDGANYQCSLFNNMASLLLTASGATNWVAPAGVTNVLACGRAGSGGAGGGGGGGGGSTAAQAGGGGAGGNGGSVLTICVPLTVVPGTTYSITVGAKGTGGNGGAGAVANAAGATGTGGNGVTASTAGGNTTFGSLYQWLGGGAGNAATAGSLAAGGAAGTAGSSPSIVGSASSSGGGGTATNAGSNGGGSGTFRGPFATSVNNASGGSSGALTGGGGGGAAAFVFGDYTASPPTAVTGGNGGGANTDGSAPGSNSNPGVAGGGGLGGGGGGGGGIKAATGTNGGAGKDGGTGSDGRMLLYW